jgi:sterol desaturase/sphingolipid hydroxylase (fatty acid hydroxylase superfamily)
MNDPELISKLIPVALLLVLGVLEAMGGLYLYDKRSRTDWTIELVSLLTLPTLVQPGIFLLTLWAGTAWFPQYEDHFVDLAIGWQVLAFLVLDDMTQYWWHRLSHVDRMMWKLHRPHHVVEEMGVLVTYRNALLYYALMPGIWFSAALIYLGMGYVYLFYLPVKLAVILLAHSETRWDRFLYKYKVLAPLAWVLERTISTPSTHFAHHGLTAEDGVSHPNGNFGNLLFIWDVLFGTAKITRRYPTRFGAWNQIKEPWYVQLFFPILRSNRPESELHALITRNDHDPSATYKEMTR